MASHHWACVSIGTCVAGLASYAIPVLQVIALLVSIAAGVKALLSKKR